MAFRAIQIAPKIFPHLLLKYFCYPRSLLEKCQSCFQKASYIFKLLALTVHLSQCDSLSKENCNRHLRGLKQRKSGI